MKTAVSVPDPVFEAAEQVARRLRLSRSQLYVRALVDYLKRKGGQGVTEKLNEVYADDAPPLDPVLARIQWASIGREEW
jgi:hypothetical protein